MMRHASLSLKHRPGELHDTACGLPELFSFRLDLTRCGSGLFTCHLHIAHQELNKLFATKLSCVGSHICNLTNRTPLRFAVLILLNEVIIEIKPIFILNFENRRRRGRSLGTRHAILQWLSAKSISYGAGGKEVTGEGANDPIGPWIPWQLRAKFLHLRERSRET